MKKKLLALLTIAAGLLLAGAAIFAREIGIDHNVEWGFRRMTLLLGGIMFLLAGISLEKIGSWMDRQRISKRLAEVPAVAFSHGLLKDYPVVVPVIGIVLIAYVWFAGAGSWKNWPVRTQYYTLLARAFQKQELHLSVQPSEKLLALSDPYDPSQRIGVGEPLDFSLYERKFYLYWGPVPALFLLPVQAETLKKISDVYLVFAFTCGLFLLQALLVVFIWRRFFPLLPKWILSMSVLLMGLSGPAPWMLAAGDIYEAAIVGGQFFTVAGFLSVYAGLQSSPSLKMKLIVTGVLWALAIGTRLTLILPIGFMVLMVLWEIWKNHSTGVFDFVHKALWLGLPILLGLLLLGSYNWARFGSFTETGFTYQLAGTHIQKHLHEVLSHRYILQNLYNYFIAPVHLTGQFPYVDPNMGSIRAILPFYQLPGFYNTNPVTGLVYFAPFIFFSLFHLRSAVNSEYLLKRDKEDIAQFNWTVKTLAGSVLVAVLFLMVFFWAAMRYVADFYPMLLLTSLLGYFRGYSQAKEGTSERRMAVLGIAAAALSIGVSTLLAVSEYII